jgi:hypothetical protein
VGGEDWFLLVCEWGWEYVARMGLSEPEQVAESRTGDRKSAAERRVGNPERFCPNCSAELRESRCKLSCAVCGFYLSCSDFY